MDFENFWAQYPRRIARMAASKAWSKLSAEQQQEAMAGLGRYKRWLLVRGSEHEFIMHASTYLNQHRWTDEYEMPEDKAAAGQWWKSTEGTLAMARKVGVNPGAGEDWEQLRARIRKQLVRAA
jgi:hypothetical protein